MQNERGLGLAHQYACPIILRQTMLEGSRGLRCRCSSLRIPHLSDVEYMEFIRNGMPVEQLLVVQVIDSRYCMYVQTHGHIPHSR